MATMICSDVIVVGFQDEIKNKISGFAGDIQISRNTSNFSFENEPIIPSDSIEDLLRKNPEIKYFHKFATKPGIVKSEYNLEGIVLKGVDKGFNKSFINQHTIEGRFLKTGSVDSPSNEGVISSSLAKRMMLKVGDVMSLYFIQTPPKIRQLTVTGIYETNVEEVDKVFIYCDLAHIQRLNNWDNNEVGGYELFVKDFKKIDEVNEEILALTRYNEDSRTIQERYPQIFDWLSLLNDNIKIILTLMGIVAIINMITALVIMIFERTRMIGLLKAMGALNSTIRGIFMYNSMMLILIGILAGNILGLGLMYAQQEFKFLTLSPESYYVSFVPVGFDWLHIGLINIGAFIFCTLAMVLPGMLVVRISPAKSLRFE